MDIDIGRQYQLRKQMTERERREALDQIFHGIFPNESPERIREIREEYVAKNYHKRKSFLPQPEKKGMIYKARLTLDEIARDIAAKHAPDTMQKRVLDFILGWLGIILLCGGFILPLKILFTGTPFMKAVVILLLVLWIGRFIIKRIKRKKNKNILYDHLMNGGLVSQKWSVEDMEWEYVTDQDDPYYSYALCLIGENGQKLRYPVSNEEFSRLREGDSVYLLYFNKEKLEELLKDTSFENPVYMVEAGIWQMDEPLQKLLGVPCNAVEAQAQGLPQTRETSSAAPDGSEMPLRGKVFLVSLCAFVVFGMLYITFDKLKEIVEQEEASAQTTEPALKPTIPESEKIVIPDPEYFFGVDELCFEEFPEAALKAYYDVMVENYGFTIAFPDLPLTHSNYLSYGESEDHDVWILPILGQDGLIYIDFIISDYCREEALETWDGEIEPFLYHPENWTECATCGGTGCCSECDGWGWIDTGGGDDKSEEICRACNGEKKCSDCWDGRVKIGQDNWNHLTDEEKRDRDWKRYAREVLNGNK